MVGISGTRNATAVSTTAPPTLTIFVRGVPLDDSLVTAVARVVTVAATPMSLSIPRG
jgi:hypothetical protein